MFQWAQRKGNLCWGACEKVLIDVNSALDRASCIIIRFRILEVVI